jgi:hypothetical protein
LGTLSSDYLARMEDVLHLYNQPLDDRRPLICFDELPVCLLDEVAPLPMQAGRPARYDYQYERCGTAVLLVAFAPLLGLRIVETSVQRTKADYCRFMQRVAAAFPDAERLVLVQDNLNTHTPGAFYAALPPAQALALAQRFEWHYTPKKGSWLNMAELELSALTRTCLARRFPTLAVLDREVQACVQQRNRKRLSVTWQFSVDQARDKLHRHYDKVLSNI